MQSRIIYLQTGGRVARTTKNMAFNHVPWRSLFRGASMRTYYFNSRCEIRHGIRPHNSIYQSQAHKSMRFFSNSTSEKYEAEVLAFDCGPERFLESSKSEHCFQEVVSGLLVVRVGSSSNAGNDLVGRTVIFEESATECYEGIVVLQRPPIAYALVRAKKTVSGGENCQLYANRIVPGLKGVHLVRPKDASSPWYKQAGDTVPPLGHVHVGHRTVGKHITLFNPPVPLVSCGTSTTAGVIGGAVTPARSSSPDWYAGPAFRPVPSLGQLQQVITTHSFLLLGEKSAHPVAPLFPCSP